MSCYDDAYWDMDIDSYKLDDWVVHWGEVPISDDLFIRVIKVR